MIAIYFRNPFISVKKLYILHKLFNKIKFVSALKQIIFIETIIFTKKSIAFHFCGFSINV